MQTHHHSFLKMEPLPSLPELDYNYHCHALNAISLVLGIMNQMETEIPYMSQKAEAVTHICAGQQGKDITQMNEWPKLQSTGCSRIPAPTASTGRVKHFR